MKNFSRIAIMLFCGGLLILTSSCVKDQDFDQADEIVIAPEVEVSLIYLQLEPVNFADDFGDLEISQVSQSTDLNFLQDAFIQNDLQRIDFTFSTENSFPQIFNTRIRFFNEMDQEVYIIFFSVPGSNTDIPEAFTYVEVVEGDALLNFKDAVRMEVVSNIVTSSDPIEGALNFQSKASLYFEFD